MKEAVRDGLRAVRNTIEDECVIPGAGAFEVFLHEKLLESFKEITGKAQLGYKAFAESVLVIPKVLAGNSGYDIQEAIIMLKDAYNKEKIPVGLNLYDFETCSPQKLGIFDNYCVKKQFLSITTTLAE